MSQAILQKLDKLSGPDGEGNYMALCPFHDDHHPSLSVNFSKGCYNCFGCGSSGDIGRLAKRLGIIDIGLETAPKTKAILNTYNYVDPKGTLLYQVVRLEPKDFKVRRPDGNGGWIWKKGIETVLYHLPDVLQAVREGQLVYICEGEKDADSLVKLGLTATTNSGGAGKWLPEYSETLKNADVVILPDNDVPGQKHANKVAASLQGKAKSIKIIELKIRDDQTVKDVSDWLSAGGTRAELEQLVKKAAEYNSKQNHSILVCMVDVIPETVSWLWPPYIPKGKLTLLEGDPGVGKSWVSLAIATAISRGKGLPGVDNTQVQDVILASAEDGLGDTIRPRLDALNADIGHIHAIKGVLDFSNGGLDTLEGYVQHRKPILVIVDPLVAYIGANVDLHRANETRTIMAKLADIANKYCCAILAVRHLTKGGTPKPLYRGLGSIDLAAACRSVLVAGCDPDNPQKKGIVHIKSNLAPIGKAIGYELIDGYFYWTGESDLTAERILAVTYDNEGKSARDEAIDFLRDVLSHGPVDAAQIWKDAREVGLAEATVKRAKSTLRIITQRKGEMGKRGGGKYTWELPINIDLGDQGDHIKKDDILNNSSFEIDRLSEIRDLLNMVSSFDNREINTDIENRDILEI